MALRGEKYTGLAVGYANICVRRVKNQRNTQRFSVAEGRRIREGIIIKLACTPGRQVFVSSNFLGSHILKLRGLKSVLGLTSLLLSPRTLRERLWCHQG